MVLGLLAGGPAGARSLADTPHGGTAEYRTAPEAQSVRGGSSRTEGPPLVPGGTYTDRIGKGEKKFYRVRLDDSSDAYVSTVLAPPPHSGIDFSDGIRISLQSKDGANCSPSNDVTFSGGSARPIGDYVSRLVGAGRECQGAGDYVYTVEWVGPGAGGPGTEGWPIELRVAAEPGLKPGAAAPSAPSTWSTQMPRRPSAGAEAVQGGTGFNDATTVDSGAWRDELVPGESRFYRVPVTWGQQLFVDAEFAGTRGSRAALVGGGMRVALFNTARGFVRSAEANYTGKPTAIAFGTAPAAYGNRSGAVDPAVGAMRFAGWYYVRVSLDDTVQSAVPVTLHLTVAGDPQPGPDYDGDPRASGLGAPSDGRAADGAAGSPLLMRTLAVAGIGTGTALLLFLAAWTALARRRGARRVRAGGPPCRP
ncbi:hypothetical protein QCN29_27340 [Streptomyces sp. HNM0663]|uniref:Peptidase n=1 Tax=Streptomyces chengmaiensis TaxID=3040919 RepID=A0ABT6HUP2_9ACTN|nr:hypothetical protein [Streptomyces chengmaiensis]MDH2392426.1 hypothetical protein [Streptomyces chengmaiensis]